MPIASVARAPRGVDAQHGADLSGAQPGDEPVEAGARRRAAGGTAEVVVDHFDVAETPLPGDLDQLVLSPPAFAIGVNLRLSGLPDVDHRFAFENRGRQQISARHRYSPRRRRRQPRAAGWPAGRASFGGPQRSFRAALPKRTGYRAGAAVPIAAGFSRCLSWTIVEPSKELRLKPCATSS